MKSRKVKSKIWKDTWFAGLSRASKLLFMYLITCEDMGLSGYAEIPDRVISFDTGLTQSELDTCKEELNPKVRFHQDWVFVVNIQKHDPIKGENNTLHKALEREIDGVPQEVISTIDAPSMEHISPSDGVIGIGKGKGKGNGIKGGVGGNKPTTEEMEKICEDYQVPMVFVESKWDDIENYCMAHGKRYKDYYRTLRDWVKRDSIKLKKEAKHGRPIVVVE